MTTAQNLLVLISDEHASRYLGCYGHPIVRTPNLDRLAARGTRFANAYTNCPICVPARASFATGRYVHELGTWDNAFPFTGEVPTWADRLQQHGRPVVSIGKLHYRDDSVLGGNGDDHVVQSAAAHARGGREGLQEAVRGRLDLAPVEDEGPDIVRHAAERRPQEPGLAYAAGPVDEGHDEGRAR